MALRFSNLHVLIETLGGMLVDLFWGTLLLLIIVIAGGLLMAVLAQPYITDENLEVTTRTFLYDARQRTKHQGFTRGVERRRKTMEQC